MIMASTYDKQYGEKLNIMLSKYSELHAELVDLNSIIMNAYEHGSDGHGGFNTNEEGLVNAMTKYLRWRGISEVVFVENVPNEGIRFVLMPESVLSERAKMYGGE